MAWALLSPDQPLSRTDAAMKTDAPPAAEKRSSAKPREPFQRTLDAVSPKRKERPPPGNPAPVISPPPGKQAVAVSVAAQVQARAQVKALVAAGDRTATTLQHARAGHELQTQQWSERSAEFDRRDVGRTEAKAFDKLALELLKPFAPDERPPAALQPVSSVGAGGGQAAGASATPSPPQTRAEAARELVQKIEVWLKTSRPALTLGVGGALQAEVTVERTGPGRVSLSLRGHHGPPSHSDVRAVKDALEQRGLLLTSVRIA